jgi:MFS family permease
MAVDASIDMPREESSSAWGVGRVVIIAAYGVLGTTLLLSRLVGLGKSLWLDELHFVEHYVRPGPRQILLGDDLSHELYGLLCWIAATTVGESEVAFRLWSAVPFIAGVAIVTVWLHRRDDPVAGVLFLFLATVSPLLLDLSRQARGYGLAFLAMAALIVAALEATRTGRPVAVLVMCGAGIVGSWTLPQFGIAFLATLAVLLTDPRLRRPAAFGLLVSVVASAAWYAPHPREVHAASQVETGGIEVSLAWIVTAPIDQVLLPALTWIDGTNLVPSLAWLPFILMVALVMASSPLLRARGPALVLLAGPLATFVFLWIIDAHTVPRYLSFLVVPLFILLASGAATILAGIPTRRAIVRTAVCLIAIAALALNFVSFAPDVVRLPREANRDAAELIDARTSPTTPLYALIIDPNGLEFYLDRPVQVLDPPDVAGRVCNSPRPLVYVMQPHALTPVDVPCLGRPGVQHHRFEQYARGGEIDVWFVPAAS